MNTWRGKFFFGVTILVLVLMASFLIDGHLASPYSTFALAVIIAVISIPLSAIANRLFR